jgi:hypothetical protein
MRLDDYMELCCLIMHDGNETTASAERGLNKIEERKRNEDVLAKGQLV